MHHLRDHVDVFLVSWIHHASFISQLDRYIYILCPPGAMSHGIPRCAGAGSGRFRDLDAGAPRPGRRMHALRMYTYTYIYTTAIRV